MKEKPREQLYGNLSIAIKGKKAIEWCMRLLRLDIDSLSESEFYDFVTEYECIVAYPEDIGFYYFTPGLFTDDNSADIPDPSEQEKIVRIAFKNYQKTGRKIISDFEKMRDKSRHWVSLSTMMKFTIRANTKGIYSINDEIEHDFKYSYAWRIARALRGKQFDDVFKKCPVCGHYYVILSKHVKQSCSHKCAMKHASRKRFQKNPERYVKRRNIEVYFSGLKKRGYTDKQIQSHMGSYIKKLNYSADEIPCYIEKSLGNRSEE